MVRMERRLIKTRQKEEFYLQFQDNVDRGVFQQITEREMEEYCTRVHELYHNGGGICTRRDHMHNLVEASALTAACRSRFQPKYPPPPALMDLYMATLRVGEHWIAFTKEISKSYQCVEADEVAELV